MCLYFKKSRAKPDTTASLLIKYSNPITINENSKFNNNLQENNIVFIEIGKIFINTPKETISFNASDIIVFDEHEKFEKM